MIFHKFLPIIIFFYSQSLYGIIESNLIRSFDNMLLLKERFENIFIYQKMNFKFKPYLLKLYFLLIKQPLKYHYGSMKTIFNDPDIGQQWYFLRQTSNITLTHDLESIWERKITGTGVIVGIVGAGIQVDHKDLKQNYISRYSYNFVNRSHIIHSLSKDKSTGYAGLIGASSNNYECGVGAASTSSIVSLQIFDKGYYMLNDIILSVAISHKKNNIYIYAMFFSVDRFSDIHRFPGFLTIKELENGHVHGRNSLGSIYLMSSGKWKLLGSNCAFRGFAQRPEIFVFGSILSNGSSTIFSETCTAILAAAITTATDKTDDLLYTTSDGNICNKSLGGSTGISLSIATGIISLLLSENPILTNRQILISIILSSTQYDNSAITNAAGYRYSYSFGFGLINATELIKISKSNVIKKLPTHHICVGFNLILNCKEIKNNSHSKFYFFSDGCLGTDFYVSKIEQILLNFTLETYSRKSVTIYITSPCGTTLKVLEPRSYDNSTEGFKNYVLKILGFFGENPFGYWIIDIFSEHFPSVLKSMIIYFYGDTSEGSSFNLIHARFSLSMIRDNIKNLSGNFTRKHFTEHF